MNKGQGDPVRNNSRVKQRSNSSIKIKIHNPETALKSFRPNPAPFRKAFCREFSWVERHGEFGCKPRDTLQYSFTLAWVDEQTMTTVTTSGREIHTFHEDDWTERVWMKYVSS